MSRQIPLARLSAVFLAVAVAAAAVAYADNGSPSSAAHSAVVVEKHYYIEIGGTGAATPAPACTSSYDNANKSLDGGIPIPVCYPASAGPLVSGTGSYPGFGAPSYTASVSQGYANLLGAVEHTYHADPHARFTIVGYSQGAQVADEVLKTIASGTTDIPKSQVDGMLYADPQQPVTGIESVAPQGLSLLGFASSGPGPVDFPGIPVERFCIHTDGICDATDVESITGYLDEHSQYGQPGNIMALTIAHDGGNGISWYPPGA